MENQTDNLTIDIEGNTKTVRIRNSKGRIEFTVSLYHFDPPQTITTPEPKDVSYLVKVREISNLNLPQDIIREFFENKDLAEKTFYDLVCQYKTLVKCREKQETPPEVSSVFMTEINYHRIDPDCCENCVNSVIDTSQQKDRNVPPRIFCRLKKNLRQFQYTEDLFLSSEIYNPPYSNKPSPLQVDFDGLCNNYSRCKNNKDN